MNEAEGFGGRRVALFESRRAAEIAALVGRHGGAAVSAPAMREVARDDPAEALAFAALLRDGNVDVVVLMTGVGTRALATAVEPVLPREQLAAALARARLIARGPKPASALRELGVKGFTAVPAPNTWREVLATLDAGEPIRGRRIAVQEHGLPNDALYAALEARGASVVRVPVYRYALPEDTRPLRDALARIAAGSIEIALFTSRAQVEHALLVASEEGLAERVRRSLARGVVGSIGPVCSEALREEGLAPDVEPEHPKMGHLVKVTADRCAAVLAEKHARDA